MTNSAAVAARALLERTWDMTLPVDVESIAKQLGLTISNAPLGFASGKLDVDENTIYVNQNEAEVRRRFTIAHELGHYVLGHGSAFRNAKSTSESFKQPVDWARYYANEIAANKFAAELLMPAEAIKVLFDRMNITSSAQLREILGVSAQALNIRLRVLGYID